MGSYFSLHDAAFWEQTITEGPEPSIWSNVNFSPLAPNQRLLLERPGRVYFSFSSGLRQGGTAVKISETADASLLVGFEEAAGRLYSAVLLKAPESMPHRYGREIEEVVLAHPAASRQQFNQPVSPSGSLDQTRRNAQPKPPLEMEKLNLENALQETCWQYLLLYSVKEGVLLFFSNDVAECEEIVRDVALSFGEKAPAPADLTMSGGRATGAAAANSATNLAGATKVQCVEHPVGRCPPGATSLITGLVKEDLRREFTVRCDAEEQGSHTNCVVFSLRVMMGLQLAVRGYDIKNICESQEYKTVLGTKAGEAACAAWENLWRRVRP